jgi:hypothetical protein
MRLKTLVIVIAFLAVASATVFFLRRPSAPVSSDARIGQPLVDQATIEKAAKVRLTENGKSVTLARESDGTWRVADYYDFPADFSKLSTFVSNLTDAKLQRLVTSSSERIARLEFKDTKIELLDAADKALWSVTLGKQAETGGGRFVRFAEEQKAYLATLSAWLDTTPKNWADTALLKLKPENVAKIEFTFADAKPITFSRAEKEDPWTSEQTPANQQVKSGSIASALNSLTGLRFSETVDPKDPAVAEAKPHERTVNLTTFDNKTISIALARKPEVKKPKPATPPADTTKSEAPENESKAPADSAAPGAEKAEPEFETIPAGPVFVSIKHSETSAPVNALMEKRAFQIYEYTFTSLPQKPEDLFEPAPAPAAPTAEKK